LPIVTEGGFDNQSAQSKDVQPVNEQVSIPDHVPAVEMPVPANQESAIDHRIIPKDDRSEEDIRKELNDLLDKPIDGIDLSKFTQDALNLSLENQGRVENV
jgi:hypothetical protein